MNLDDLRASTAAVLTVTQTAAILRDLDGNTLDERTVRRACQDGQIQCIYVGRRLLIPREPLLALLTSPSNSSAEPRQDSAAATLKPVEGACSHGATNQLRSA